MQKILQCNFQKGFIITTFEKLVYNKTLTIKSTWLWSVMESLCYDGSFVKSASPTGVNFEHVTAAQVFTNVIIKERVM